MTYWVSFVRNNPIKYIDPTGHILLLATAAIGGAIGAIAGAVGYTAYTAITGTEFNTGHMLLAAGGGAVAGALIGTGIGWAAGVGAAEATAAGVTAASAAEAANAACGGDMCASEASDVGNLVNDVAPVVENSGASVSNAELVGQKVFRVWGGSADPLVRRSGPNGNSWSPIDPSTVTNYRDVAGLPDVNTGRFVSEGIINNLTGIITRSAWELDGNAGGLLEYVIPYPETQVTLTNVSGTNPPY